MAPKWSSNLVQFPRLPTQPTSEAPSISLDMAATSTSQFQPSLAASTRRRTSLGRHTVAYGRLHLLWLPGEVRLGIWCVIHYNFLFGSDELWFRHPSTAWDGLQLTCRQIHLEIAEFRPCSVVLQAEIEKIFTQVLSIKLLTNFRRLSVELPFNLGRIFHESFALALKGLQMTLEDLRLFFVGKDKFNVKSFVHGCGLRDPCQEKSSTKLMIDGQYGKERKTLFFALFFLQRLRTLVVKNANHPLLQSMIIKHRPQLEYLHISADPRLCLHTKYDLGDELNSSFH